MTTLLLIPTRAEQDLMGLRETDGIKVRVCGMGSMASGISAARWLQEVRPEFCVLVGLAGTRDETCAPLGGLVVGTAVRNEAVGAGHGADFLPLGEMAPAGEGGVPDALPLDVPTKWLKVGTRFHAETSGGPAIVAGEIGTVAAASASIEEADSWRSRDPAVLVEEMEGYAVGLACREAGVPFSIVRGVSNRAGLRDKTQWQAVEAVTALRTFLEQALGVLS
ncbi:MAG: hypothetical protein P8N09_07050 [Planctomycetota bacterium]|nr:hypothetical protein [Planctomycetota bacterium]